MSIQSVQSQAQNAGLYQIRKKAEAQGTEQVQAEQAVQQVQQADEYDKANPLGTEAEGVYSVSYDEDGNMKVSYSQRSGKSDVQASGETGEAGGTGGAQAGGEASSTSDTDTIEEEIERLKKQRDQIKQQLNKAQDEDTKKALRAQLQAIEVQIAQLTAQQK